MWFFGCGVLERRCFFGKPAHLYNTFGESTVPPLTPPWMTEGSGTELLIVWFQLLTSLPARKWSHCLFGGGRVGESGVFRDWEGLQLLITHTLKRSAFLLWWPLGIPLFTRLSNYWMNNQSELLWHSLYYGGFHMECLSTNRLWINPDISFHPI